MDKHSIGKFIAILRKAKGMTQKDLGDLLNVSDKTISRWERDETMPDVSLIPILSEILGVTSDELLRGERLCADIVSENSDKFRQRVEWVLNKSFSKYRSLSMLSISFMLVGIIAAAICNFVFHKATLGFFCFLIGFLPGCLCQMGLYLYYRGGTEVQDIPQELIVQHHCRINDITRKYIYVFLSIFAFALPLLLFGQISYSEYLMGISFEESMMGKAAETMPTIAIGLQSRTWGVYGSLFVLGNSAGCFLFDSILKYVQTKNSRRLKYIAVTLIIIAFTLLGAVLFRRYIPNHLVKGNEFYDYQEFVNYMEEIPDDMAWGVVELRKDNPYWMRQVYDTDGNVLCEYTLYNDDVVDITYGKGSLRLPITTYTQEQLDAGEEKAEDLMWIWGAAVLMECIISVLVYKKKQNIQRQS